MFPSLEARLEALLKKSPHLIPYIKDFVVAISAIKSTSTCGASPLVESLPFFTHLKSLSIKTYGGVVINWRQDIPINLRGAFSSIFLRNRLEEFVLQDIHDFDTTLPASCSSLRVLVIGGEGTLAPFTPRHDYPCTPPPLSVMMIGTGKDSLQTLMGCCSPETPAFALDNLQWLGLRELPGTSWINAFRILAQSSLSMLKHLVIELEVKSCSYRLQII